MKKWKLNQHIYHRLVRSHADDLNHLKVTFDENIVESAVAYFEGKSLGIVYPAKSYFVAICYAKWLNQDFGDDFKQALDEADLLFTNDPHFTRYSQAKAIYDGIIEKIGLDFDETIGIIPIVREYYLKEVHLKDFSKS